MSWFDSIKKKLSPNDEPLEERLKKAEKAPAKGSELVGKGPVPPFRTMEDKARAELDTGIAAYKELEGEPTMTKERFKQTLDLAKKGSKEAKTLLDRLKMADVEKQDPDAMYDFFFKKKDK